MSLTAIVAVRETDGGLSSRDKMVLMALADYADDQNEAWPSHNTLATWTHMSRSTVIRALQSLEEAGYVTATQRRRPDGSYSSKRYRLNIQLMRENAHLEKERGCVTVTQGGSTVVQGGYHSDTPRTPSDPPKNKNINTSPVSGSEGGASKAVEAAGKKTEKVSRAAFNAATLELPEHVDAELWAEFVRHRVDIRKRLTERSANMVLRKLAHARDANAAIRAAIEHGWTSVHPRETQPTPVQAAEGTKNAPQPKLRRGDRVRLPDGTAGVVERHSSVWVHVAGSTHAYRPEELEVITK